MTSRNIVFRILLILPSVLFFSGRIAAQCTSGFTSITSTENSQKVNDIDISISSPTTAQSTRVTYGSINGYYISDENHTEEILFRLSKPVTQIRIIARALSAPFIFDKIEYFTLEINGVHHKIQPSELLTPDPVFGRECILQTDGSILGDTVPNHPYGDGSFIFTYAAPNNSLGITSFKIKDSVARLTPEGAIFEVQIYSKCITDTTSGSGTTVNSFFIPSAFTPNQDGKNDLFTPLISGNIKQYEFFVFNRWGQVVFHSKDYTKGWDGKILGKEQDNNVFIWQCSYQFAGKAIQRRKGTVVLIK